MKKIKKIITSILLISIISFIPAYKIYHKVRHDAGKITINAKNVSFNYVGLDMVGISFEYEISNNNPFSLEYIEFYSTFINKNDGSRFEMGNSVGMGFHDENSVIVKNNETSTFTLGSARNIEIDNTIQEMIDNGLKNFKTEYEIRDCIFSDGKKLKDDSGKILEVLFFVFLVIVVILNFILNILGSLGGGIRFKEVDKRGPSLNKMKNYNRTAAEFKNAGLYKDANIAEMNAQNAFVDSITDDANLKNDFRKYSFMEANYKNGGLTNDANRAKMWKENKLAEIISKSINKK